MKQILSALLMVVLIVSLTVCGGQAEQLQERNNSQTNVGTNSLQRKSELISEPISETESLKSVKNTSDILIVYFSRWGNTDYPDDVDATTSASIVIDEDTRYGTTEYVANIIAKEVGGDLHQIETITPYSADFDELRDINHNEMNQNYLPELKESNLDISKHNTVFIGYPVWATGVPQAVISFLDEYKLLGKTIIPFCTHDGYGAGNSYSTISKESHAERVLDGLAIKASDVHTSKNTVIQWLASIGISNNQDNTTENGETQIKITVGDIVLDGVIYDTDLSKEIMANLPLTVSMVGYGGREYYGGIEFTPKNISKGQLKFNNGDITYCTTNNSMAIFYAQTDRPNLTMEVIPIGRVTSDLSVFDTFNSREEITFSLLK